MHRGGRGRGPQRVTNQAAKDRFLGENLGGAVFGATWETLNECTTGLVFGLPNSNWNWVQHVKEGMPIFLFNYTDKMMHGIFRAVTPGTLNINPYGWTRISNTPHTRYPAQVKVEQFENCQPIVDRDFKSAIQGAFFTDKQFNYQLTAEEARKLCTMFSRSAARRLYEKKPAAAGTVAVPAFGQESSAPPGPSSPTQGSPGGHPSSRRPTPSSSTGSSELRHARSWEDTATAATAATTASALNQADRSAKVEDTSTSRGEQAEPSQQISQQMSHAASAAEAAVGNGNIGTKSVRKPPPGFDDPHSAAARPMKDRLQVKYEAWQPTAVASSLAPDATAAGSSPQLQGLPAKPMLAGRPHRYRPGEAEVRLAAEQTEEEDQGAKRSRKGRSPHHPHTLATPSPPESAAEEEVQAPHSDNGGRPTGLQPGPIPLVVQQQAQQQPQQAQQQPQQAQQAQQARQQAQQQPQQAPQQPQQAQQQPQQARQQAKQQPQQAQQQPQQAQQAQQHPQQAQQAEQSGLDEGDVHMMGTTPTGSSALDRLAALTANHASTQQASKIYLLGGGTESQDSMWLSTVDVYSPMTHSCQPATPLPTESAYGSAVAMGNQLFYVGGGNGVDWFRSMLRLPLDDTDGEWEQMADMHLGRGSLCTANLNSMVWAVGGRDSHTFHNSTECFHPALNVWTVGPSTLTKRFAAAGGVLGGAIYVTGGFDASTYTGTAERLDPREKKWSQIPDMLSSRGSHACAVFDDKLYAIGGYAALKPLRDVEVFDPRANRWQAIAQMNDTRAYFAGVACQGSLYAIGGLSPERGTPNYNHTLEKYDPMHDSWQVMQPAANALSARAFMSACVV